MRVVTDNTINFAKYLQGPAEAPNVRPASSWREEVKAHLRDGTKVRGATLPWRKTHDVFRLRDGEVTIWAGINGHGKSLATSNIALWLAAQGERLCVASMEMRPEKTMHRMTRQAMARQFPTNERVDNFFNWTDNRLWLYDQQGTVKADRMLALGRYCKQELYCTHLIIDSLMKCGFGVDDYTGQKNFVDQLCALAQDTGLHIHLIAHARKGKSEHEMLDKFDIKGASEITDQVDNVVLVWRNKAKEDAESEGDYSKRGEPDCLLNVCKQRHGEWEGKVRLWLDKPSMSYLDDLILPPLDYLAMERQTI